MARYYSERALFEKTGISGEIHQARKVSQEEEVSGKFSAEASLTGLGIEGRESQKRATEWEYSGRGFHSVEQILIGDRHRFIKPRKAQPGDLVKFEEAKVTAAAIEILQIKEEVRENFQVDTGTSDFKVFGGYLEPRRSLFDYFRRETRFYLLGSLDNRETMERFSIPAANLPNSFPSDAAAARFLLYSLYQVEPNRRERANLPTDDAALESYADMVHRSITGGEGYMEPKLDKNAIAGQKCRVIATVTMVGAGIALLRPIVIE